jgi:alpha-tubulin suppressor-like RCC1 family protein
MFRYGRPTRLVASAAVRSLSRLAIPRTHGQLLVQGVGVFGATASPDLTDAEHFQPINSELSLPVNDAVKAAATWGHSVVTDSAGRLLIFGRPYDFITLMRIRRFHQFNKWFARHAARMSNTLMFGEGKNYYETPTQVDTKGKVTDVAISAGLTTFVTEKGDVYCFGQNRWNQCGFERGEADMHVFEPFMVPGLPPIQKIDTGLQHCIALSCDGSVYSWGKAGKGQLGSIPAYSLKEMPLSGVPAQVLLGNADFNLRRNIHAAPVASKLKATAISAGSYHSAAVTEDGAVYVWGAQMSEQLYYKDYYIGRARSFVHLSLFNHVFTRKAH